MVKWAIIPALKMSSTDTWWVLTVVISSDNNNWHFKRIICNVCYAGVCVCVCVCKMTQKDDSEKYILEQWFSQNGPKTSSSSATWKLLEMPISEPHPDLLK